MKHSYRIAINTTAAALFAVLLLTPGRGQAPTAQEKAKIRARNIAQITELASRFITIYDRQGKMVKTVGPPSMRASPMAICRILPPGAAARSKTSTSRPRAARSSAAARPPTPAPMTTTRRLMPRDPGLGADLSSCGEFRRRGRECQAAETLRCAP